MTNSGEKVAVTEVSRFSINQVFVLGADGGSRFIFDLPVAEPASKDCERTAGSNDA